MSISTSDPVLNMCPESKNGGLFCGGRLCEHFPELCPMCFIEKGKGDFSDGIYSNQCFYCYINGNMLIMGGTSNYNKIPDHRYKSHDVYKIGYCDGYNKKVLPDTTDYFNDLKEIYIDGYEAGKTMRELEECKERFCILFPDFLAKTDN